MNMKYYKLAYIHIEKVCLKLIPQLTCDLNDVLFSI